MFKNEQKGSRTKVPNRTKMAQKEQNMFANCSVCGLYLLWPCGTHCNIEWSYGLFCDLLMAYLWSFTAKYWFDCIFIVLFRDHSRSKFIIEKKGRIALQFKSMHIIWQSNLFHIRFTFQKRIFQDFHRLCVNFFKQCSITQYFQIKSKARNIFRIFKTLSPWHWLQSALLLFNKSWIMHEKQHFPNFNFKIIWEQYEQKESFPILYQNVG